MKTLALLFLSSLSMACPKGSVEYNGACYVDIQPEKGASAPEVQPSNEKPSRHPESAWERGEVKAALPSSLVAQDLQMDQQKAQAEAQGKKAAGVK